MLNIKIDNPEIEDFIVEKYGGSTDSLMRAFIEYIQTEKIREDVRVSEEEFEKGDYMDIDDAFKLIKAKYANK